MPADAAHDNRRQDDGAAAVAAAAPLPHAIDPHAVYSIAAARAALGLAKETLPREIRLGRLQARQRGGRYLILGQWLVDWIATGRPHRNWPQGKARSAAANGSGRR